MALTIKKSIVLPPFKRYLFNVSIMKSYSRMPDPIDHATGLEKRELLARVAGCDDPYGMNILKRGPGTKDKPNLVPSAFHERIVGCICEWNSQSVNYMWLYKGEPRRCECGHWFKLVHKPPL